VKREWIALAFAMLLPSGLAYVYFVALGPSADGQTNTALLVAYPAAKLFQFSLPLLFMFRAGSVGFGDSTNPARPRLMKFAMLFGFVVAAAIIVVAQLLQDSVLVGVPAQVAKKVAEFGAATPLRYLALAAFLSLLHSFLEEYYWRWFIFARLRTLLPFIPAAVLSGLAFAAHHLFVLNIYLPGQFWSAAVPFTLGIALGGVFWAWLYERSWSLLGPWLSHMIVDAAIMAVGYKMVFLR
jgi:uncharacterized protein